LHWSFIALIHEFGAIGVGLGAAMEGETAVVLGGIAARHAFFSPYAAALAASMGSFLVDQLCFGLGRWRRDGNTVRRIAGKRTFAQGLAFIDRHPLTFCIGFRFVYGFRVAGPVALGVSQVPTRLFVPLNFLSAVAWASIFTFVGYHFGKVAERDLRQLLTPPHFLAVSLFAVTIAGCFWLWRRWRQLPTRSQG
jgi:membrane protein DedA with SNARE-associated domain